MDIAESGLMTLDGINKSDIKMTFDIINSKSSKSKSHANKNKLEANSIDALWSMNFG